MWLSTEKKYTFENSGRKKMIEVEIINFLGVRKMALETNGMGFVFGPNESGKTSTAEAIRYGLIGEVRRVKWKKEYGSLVTGGADRGLIMGELHGQPFDRDVGTGEGKGIELSPAHRLGLDIHAFSQMHVADRKKLLSTALRVKVSTAEVSNKLNQAGVPTDIQGRTMTLLKAGLESAAKEAANLAKEARAKWCQVTGSGKYGVKVAADWKAPRVDADEGKIKVLQERIERNEREHQELYAQAEKMKLGRDSLKCPHCRELVYIGQRSAMEDKPILIKGEAAFDEKAFNEIQKKLINLNIDLGRDRNAIGAVKEAVFRRDKQAEIQATANKLHEANVAWELVVSLLGPDGLAGDVLARSLAPLRERLAKSAQILGWRPVTLSDDMELLMDGRPYLLHSESAQWRMDLIITEAICFLTKAPLLMIDRIDVLDEDNRASLLGYLERVASNEEQKAMLCFGTFTQQDAPQLGWAPVYWLQEGRVVNV
jgi:hypothetical protein